MTDEKLKGPIVNRRDALKIMGKDLAKALTGEIEDLSITKMMYSYNVVVDEDKCTICGACVHVCPRKAFKLDVDEDNYYLLFNQSLCDGCNICIEKCPENALTLVKSEEQLSSSKYVRVASSPIARCRICGRPIGPKKALDRIADKLREKGLDSIAEKVYLCDECKRRTSGL